MSLNVKRLYQCTPTSLKLACLFLLPLIVLGGLWFGGTRTLDLKISKIRKAGLPTNLDELQSYYVDREEFDDQSDLWIQAIRAVERIQPGKRAGGLPIIGEGPDPVPGEKWAQFKEARVFLDELTAEFEIIHQATAAGGQVRFPSIPGQDLGHASLYYVRSRELQRLLALHAHVAAYEGIDDLCFQDIQGGFALANALAGGVTTLSFLTRIAHHAIVCDLTYKLLPVCSWSDGQLQAMQESLCVAQFREGLNTALIGERALSLSYEYPLPLQTSNQIEILDFFELTLENAGQPWPTAITEQSRLTAKYDLSKSNTLTKLRTLGVSFFAPTIEPIFQSTVRAEARQRCLNTSLAIRRQQLARGTLPTKLSEIDRKYLGPEFVSREWLTDPYDGKSLRYIVDGDRFLVYSIGENQVDDGGNVEFDEQHRQVDLGFWVDSSSE